MLVKTFRDLVDRVRGIERKKSIIIYNWYDELSVIWIQNKLLYESKLFILIQAVLCGPLGYESFMREDWIKMTLRWLDTHYGCFRMTLADLEQLTDEMVNEIYEGRNVSKATVEKAKVAAEEESKESFEKEQAKELKEE